MPNPSVFAKASQILFVSIYFNSP